jgi:hypothetical protein
MLSPIVSVERQLGLQPGDVVRIRSAEEIARTLDEDGKLDGLPFMPEMLAYCGKTMSVLKRADKTCAGRGKARRMNDAVHLTGVRCDGSAHGGCQAACLMYWKEAWLERARMNGASPVAGANGPAPVAGSHSGTPAVPPPDQLLLVAATAATTKDGDPDEDVYQCQATEVLNATRHLPLWEPDQYVQDVRNWGVRKLVRNLVISGFNRFQDASRRYLPEPLRIRRGQRYPALAGRLEKTPKATLGLQPGDLVRVKSKEEILATLDTHNRNRGLMFDVEMLRYCGKTARVNQRIERIIDEHTGKMLEINSDCVTLEGFVCVADYHRLCTRSVYEYFREIWLERV